MGKSSDETELGNRLKSREKFYENKIPHDEYLIVRLDGKKFRKFTKGFEKPFDKILSKTMEETTRSLVEEYNPTIGYTQSDEITLIFKPNYHETLIPIVDFGEVCEGSIWENKKTKEQGQVETNEDIEDYRLTYYIEDEKVEDFIIYGEQGFNVDLSTDKKEIIAKYNFYRKKIDNHQIFNGRTQKIVSDMAAFASVNFNMILMDELKQYKNIVYERWENSFRPSREEKEDKEKVSTLLKKVGKARFDARTFGVQNIYEAYNALLWRVRDCVKNSKSAFAQTYCSHTSLQNLTSQEQIEFCKKETGKDWDLIENKYKYGIFLKKEKYQIENKNPKYDDVVTRTRIIDFSHHINFDEELVNKLINEKFLESEVKK